MKKETINVNLRNVFFNELSVWSEKNISVTYCPDSQPTSETSKQIPTPISLYQPPSFFCTFHEKSTHVEATKEGNTFSFANTVTCYLEWPQGLCNVSLKQWSYGSDYQMQYYQNQSA
jgi:hypothetical protein